MVIKVVDKSKMLKKKRTKKFIRFQSDRFNRLSKAWRKPKGIDNRVRRRFRSTPRMPNVGYGSPAATRHVLPCGLRKFVIRRMEDLDMLIMHNKALAAEIFHGVSARHRKMIVARADELGIYVTNKHARLHVEEAE